MLWGLQTHETLGEYSTIVLCASVQVCQRQVNGCHDVSPLTCPLVEHGSVRMGGVREGRKAPRSVLRRPWNKYPEIYLAGGGKAGWC
jgi:hypothetical protein